MAGVGYGPEYDRMARYDLAADRWTMVDVGSSAAAVGVPDSDGRVSTFVSLPSEKGAPVQLIEGTGSLIAELPAFSCCVAPPGSGGSIYRVGTTTPSEVP